MKYNKIKKEDKEKITKELYDLYIIQDKSISEISRIYNCTISQIWSKFKSCKIKSKSKKYKPPKIGAKFNRLKFINEFRDENNCLKWTCECECGNITTPFYLNVHKGITQSCGCRQKELISKRTWTGYAEMSGRYLANVKRSAKLRNIEYSVSNEYIWNIFIKQNRKCEFTGEELFFARLWHQDQQNASLDRIDSNLGYIEGNVQWTTKDVNICKHSMNNEEFLEMCRIIAENNPRKTE